MPPAPRTVWLALTRSRTTPPESGALSGPEEKHLDLRRVAASRLKLSNFRGKRQKHLHLSGAEQPRLFSLAEGPPEKTLKG